MGILRKTIINDEQFLRHISKSVDFASDKYEDAVQELANFCQNEENCMALASIQIGIPLRVIYLKKTDLNRLYEEYNEAKVLINPVIIKSKGETEFWEACVSCLNYTGLVKRPYEIEVMYYDISKKKHHETFTGFAATVISHEIDHLNGILHMDIAEKIIELNADERKSLRQIEPYKVIRKTGKYIHPKNK